MGSVWARGALGLFVGIALLGGPGCADSDDGEQSGPTRGLTGDVKQGGSVRIAHTEQPDSLDPALSYSANAWEALWLVYTPLLTYRHAEGERGAELIPGLAERLPEVSADGRTYRLRLRRGLRYSDGTRVRAADFEHAIKRVLSLESGGSSFYLGIVGAKRYQRGGGGERDLPGIVTDDRARTITIRLTEPDGTFANALALPFAGLVPSTAPFESLTADPPPGVGPYALAEVRPNRGFVLRRNRRMPEIEGIARGNLDRISVRLVGSLQRQTQDVIRGRLDFMQDPPASDQLAEVRRRYPDRYKQFPTGSTYYFFLNTRLEPFDDVRVRRAVNLALDKDAIRRLYAGLLEPACTLLPPVVPGYRRREPCPYGQGPLRSRVERARALVRAAGADGADVTVWGSTTEQGTKISDYYVQVLKEIGLDPEPKRVSDSVYLQTIGNQDTKAQTGFNTWFQDFPHPANFFFIVDGDSIQPTNNPNPGNVSDPQINAGIDRLRRERSLSETAEAWARLDQTLIDRALIVPVGHRRLTTFMSERMDFEDCSPVHPLFQNDYSGWCLK